MGEPEYIVIINGNVEHNGVASSATDAIKKAIERYESFWRKLQDDYARASDEEKKQYDEENLWNHDIREIRVYGC